MAAANKPPTSLDWEGLTVSDYWGAGNVAPVALAEDLAMLDIIVVAAVCTPYAVPCLSHNPYEATVDDEWRIAIRHAPGTYGLRPVFGKCAKLQSTATNPSASLTETSGPPGFASLTPSSLQGVDQLPVAEAAASWVGDTEIVLGSEQVYSGSPPAADGPRALRTTAGLVPATERIVGGYYASVTAIPIQVANLS